MYSVSRGIWSTTAIPDVATEDTETRTLQWMKLALREEHETKTLCWRLFQLSGQIHHHQEKLVTFLALLFS